MVLPVRNGNVSRRISFHVSCYSDSQALFILQVHADATKNPIISLSSDIFRVDLPFQKLDSLARERCN